MKVVLIYPPFGAPGQPGIGISSLAAYLKRRKIDARVLDANNAFYRAFLSPLHLRLASDFMVDRIAELNAKPQLHFTEIVEYGRLVRVGLDAIHWREEMGSLLDQRVELSLTQRLQAIKAAVNLSSLPYFPDIVDIQSRFLIKYLSPLCEYSSRDILKSIEQSGWLSGLLRDVLEPELRKEAPELVGISVCFPSQVLAGFHCARLVKQVSPQAHVCMGGSFISCHMRNIEEARLFDVVDSFALDDGEIPLEHLIEEMSGLNPDLNRVPGLIHLSNGRIYRNPAAPPLDLESLPAPDYRLLPLDDYVIPRKHLTAPFRLSRGCAWKRCAFCRTDLPMVSRSQQPSADFLYEQIRNIVDQTGVSVFHFTDDSASPEILEALSRRMITDKLRIEWSTSLRFDPRLTVERCMLYRRAGCTHVMMGLEAYNNRLLRLMNKGITTDLADRVLLNMSWAGLPAAVYMIVGFPTETEEEAMESWLKVEEMKRDGLIVDYMYAPYQITNYSSVAKDPGKFGITHMSTPEYMDLEPPIFDFESSGMHRKRVFEVGMLTGSMLGTPRVKSPLAHPAPIEAPCRRIEHGVENSALQKLSWNGRVIRLDYDVTRIRAIMETAIDASLSIGEWYAKGESLIRPLKRRPLQQAPGASTAGCPHSEECKPSR
jgi:hypothetical protein